MFGKLFFFVLEWCDLEVRVWVFFLGKVGRLSCVCFFCFGVGVMEIVRLGLRGWGVE